jgi:hypothetical protein
MKRKEENRQWGGTARDQIHTKKQQQPQLQLQERLTLEKVSMTRNLFAENDNCTKPHKKTKMDQL